MVPAHHSGSMHPVETFTTYHSQHPYGAAGGPGAGQVHYASSHAAGLQPMSFLTTPPPNADSSAPLHARFQHRASAGAPSSDVAVHPLRKKAASVGQGLLQYANPPTAFFYQSGMATALAQQMTPADKAAAAAPSSGSDGSSSGSSPDKSTPPQNRPSKVRRTQSMNSVLSAKPRQSSPDSDNQ
eukprot:ANDGO_01456.mRNA.1 hypothetical protein